MGENCQILLGVESDDDSVRNQHHSFFPVLLLFCGYCVPAQRRKGVAVVHFTVSLYTDIKPNVSIQSCVLSLMLIYSSACLHEGKVSQLCTHLSPANLQVAVKASTPKQ